MQRLGAVQAWQYRRDFQCGERRITTQIALMVAGQLIDDADQRRVLYLQASVLPVTAQRIGRIHSSGLR